MKTCSLCQILKPFGAFYSAATKDGRMKRCKSCACSYIRDFVDKNAPWDDDRREALRKHRVYLASKKKKRRTPDRLTLLKELRRLRYLELDKKQWVSDPAIQAKRIRVVEWAKRKENEQTNNQEKTGTSEQPVCCT